jgi:hypothetical protein
MVRDSAKAITVVIALGIVLAATSTLFLHIDSNEMALRARDVGPGWRDNGRRSPIFPANITIDNLTFSEYDLMSNETSIISDELWVFNSPEASLDWYLNKTIFVRWGEEATIGDLGCIYRYGGAVAYIVIIDGQVFSANPSNMVGVMFIEANVLSIITVAVKGVDTPTQPWIYDFALDLGLIQLQKIDQYLAQHPGAS